ncbi:MAG: hypothetical protein COT13_02155 [Chloroflexi bacterium CG08_land_8_20_14_0_20_45_12]|nr:MAG: hypothetical protein COX52_10265 [Syntrophobacterales bacterium CG23_combo_of_CG06-09_8_20_14_all_48_27]PIU23609.1 MAG: hypothetical protein COT13_02155 [Chloroflexi bacterium CG08_land_8_20_14_0_20_45_12]
MPGFDGTGPRGMGPMTGGGRGFCSPWGVRVARPTYGFPRRAPYASPYYGAYGFGPFAPQMTREQELEFLKTESQALREELKELEDRIGQLSAERK